MFESLFLYQQNLSRTKLKCFKKCDVNTVAYELIGKGERTFLTNFKNPKKSVNGYKCMRDE